MKKVIAVFTMLVLVSGAQADVSLNIGGELFRDSAGDALFYVDLGTLTSVHGNLFMLIGDPSGDGFQSVDAITDNLGFLGGDDVLIDAWGVNAENTYIDGNLSHSISGFDMVGSGLSQGDKIALVWFESLMGSAVDPAALGAKPGEDQPFGVLLPDKQDPMWTLPSDGGQQNYFHTFSGAAADTGKTDLVTTPEPMTFAVLALGGGIVAARRRRNKRA